ncbi:MAG: hypothetical protein K6A45_03140 [Lachnospiraceae bacterium]|nr:hypothetical protein [Lachnospiraceae bacterium]
MGKKASKLIVLFVVLALFLGLFPAGNIEAAKKKSKTSITVSTQEELVKALKSGKYKKITIKTDAKVSFTLAAKYSNSDLKIVVDAKNATFNSKGTVGSIVVNEAKTVKEYASGNNITVNDEKLTFKAMGGASVEKIKVASETGAVRIVNNGAIGRVDVTGESKVDVEQNGSVGRLYVAAAAEIGVTGKSEEKLAVTVKPEAAGAAVKSELPVKVNAYADVDLQLEKGAENSAVTLKNEDAGVKLENNTDKKVTVTDSDGEKQIVKKGEDLTSDNYVGKPEETDDGTEGESSGMPSEGTEGDKKEDEDKEEEKKEEEKKDDTTSTSIGGSVGGGSQGGESYNPYIPPRAEWGTPIYEWSTDNKTLTATLPCTNQVENDIVETVGVTITGTTAPTCTEKGSTLFTSEDFIKTAFTKQTMTIETDALEHDWGDVTYTWSEDNKSLTATRKCKRDELHIETETVDVTETVTAATCTETGTIVYTSEEFKNASFTKQTKTVEIGALGHDWGEVTYAWSEDNKTLTATRKCNRDQSDVETETVKTDEVITPATCTEKGSIVYTSIDFENAAFTKQTKTIEIDAVGHNWGEVTFTWSENKKYVTAERICANNNKHIETETAEVISETTKQPKCGETGEITYTASFTNAEFGTWSEKETLPALDHDYSLAEESIPKPIFKESLDEGGYLECTGWEKGVNTYVCANDSNHSYTEEVKVPMEIIAEELGDGICEIDGSSITIDLGEKLEQYNENNGTHASWTEAFGNQTIGEYIYSLAVYPYNDELKQWWIIPDGLNAEESNKLESIQAALYAFIGDGIGEFVFENEEDAVTVIDDILYTGEAVTYNVKFVPKDADTFETLEITATFILPVMELDIIG